MPEVHPPIGQAAEVYLSRIENSFSLRAIHLINKLLLFMDSYIHCGIHYKKAHPSGSMQLEDQYYASILINGATAGVWLQGT